MVNDCLIWRVYVAVRKNFVATRHCLNSSLALAVDAPWHYNIFMKQPELTALARRYLDLWEQQIAAGGSDKAGGAAAEAARIMAEALSLMASV